MGYIFVAKIETPDRLFVFNSYEDGKEWVFDSRSEAAEAAEEFIQTFALRSKRATYEIEEMEERSGMYGFLVKATVGNLYDTEFEEYWYDSEDDGNMLYASPEEALEAAEAHIKTMASYWEDVNYDIYETETYGNIYSNVTPGSSIEELERQAAEKEAEEARRAEQKAQAAREEAERIAEVNATIGDHRYEEILMELRALVRDKGHGGWKQLEEALWRNGYSASHNSILDIITVTAEDGREYMVDGTAVRRVES